MSDHPNPVRRPSRTIEHALRVVLALDLPHAPALLTDLETLCEQYPRIVVASRLGITPAALKRVMGSPALDLVLPLDADLLNRVEAQVRLAPCSETRLRKTLRLGHAPAARVIAALQQAGRVVVSAAPGRMIVHAPELDPEIAWLADVANRVLDFTAGRGRVPRSEIARALGRDAPIAENVLLLLRECLVVWGIGDIWVRRYPGDEDIPDVTVRLAAVRAGAFASLRDVEGRQIDPGRDYSDDSPDRELPPPPRPMPPRYAHLAPPQK